MSEHRDAGNPHGLTLDERIAVARGLNDPFALWWVEQVESLRAVNAANARLAESAQAERDALKERLDAAEAVVRAAEAQIKAREEWALVDDANTACAPGTEDFDKQSAAARIAAGAYFDMRDQVRAYRAAQEVKP